MNRESVSPISFTLFLELRELDLPYMDYSLLSLSAVLILGVTADRMQAEIKSAQLVAEGERAVVVLQEKWAAPSWQSEMC